MFEVKLEAFNGPLAKLLELIEERQLEVTKVNLAQVTADFIRYVETLGSQVEPAILSDFVVVAARLLVIKSKVLLPSLELSQEEESDIIDLEHRLKVYREFKAASEHIKTLWNKKEVAFTKPLLASLGDTSFFYPSKQVTTERLESAMISLFSVLQGLVPETKQIKMTVVTLQEKIAELTERLSKATAFTVKGKAGKHEKQEIIVLFLAVLHMLAARTLNVEQSDMFSDIVVRKQEQAT